MNGDEARDVIQEIKRLRTLKEQKAEAEQEIQDIESFLSKTMDDRPVRVQVDADHVIQATVVRATMDRFDTYVLQHDPKVWAAVTEPTLSKERYLEAVRRGIVSKDLHSLAYHQVPKRAYVTTKLVKIVNKENADA